MSLSEIWSGGNNYIISNGKTETENMKIYDKSINSSFWECIMVTYKSMGESWKC
jgi:hypothetical protein